MDPRRRTTALIVVLTMTVQACGGVDAGTDADREEPLTRACGLAAQLVQAPPWPPPDDMGLRQAVEIAAEPTLTAALQAALAHTTDHERIVSVDHRAVAPTEAVELVDICDRLGVRVPQG